MENIMSNTTKESYCPYCSKVTTQTKQKGDPNKGKCHGCGNIVS